MAQRKLAAIMFSDIVGYNSLLESDEKKAFKNNTEETQRAQQFGGDIARSFG